MCCNKGFIKRVIPFFLTFAVGIFIASFFVTVAAPSFQFPNRGERRRHQERDEMREFELQRLREENFQLKQTLSDKDDTTSYESSADVLSVPPPPPPPAAPARISRR